MGDNELPGQGRPQSLGAKVVVEHVHRGSLMGMGQNEVGSSEGWPLARVVT